MNSSRSPWPSSKEAKAAFTNSEMRAAGYLGRRERRKGTRIARSPRFQYSITRMLRGGELADDGGGGDGDSGRIMFARNSKARTRRALRGVIFRKCARAMASRSR